MNPTFPKPYISQRFDANLSVSIPTDGIFFHIENAIKVEISH